MITATVPVPRDATGLRDYDNQPFVMSFLEGQEVEMSLNNKERPDRAAVIAEAGEVILEVQGAGKLAKRYTYAQLRQILLED